MLLKYLIIASLLPSTTYGWNETMCGDVGAAVKCSHGAITASGVPLKPREAQMAIAVPANLRLPSRGLYIDVEAIGPNSTGCHTVLLTDKMNSRWVGERGFDLTPGAVQLLTGSHPTPQWSGRVSLCEKKRDYLWDVSLELLSLSRLHSSAEPHALPGLSQRRP